MHISIISCFSLFPIAHLQRHWSVAKLKYFFVHQPIKINRGIEHVEVEETTFVKQCNIDIKQRLNEVPDSRE